MQELDSLLKEQMDYFFSQVHTTFPGVVTEYDAATRRATVQPSLKRHTGKKEFVEYPLLIDVPVQYPGTKKFTIHFPLEKGDEVAVFFSERAIGLWKQTGMDGIEDPKPRRFSLPDAYCTPGLHPVEFIRATKEGALQILHQAGWDGDFISSVIMDDDMVEAKYKEKATILMEDDHIKANTEKCSVDMTADVAKMNNSQLTMKLNAAKASIKNGSKDLFTVIDKWMADIIAMKTVGSPTQHVISPDDLVKLNVDKTDFGQVMEAG
jgi:hypothetical protein